MAGYGWAPPPQCTGTYSWAPCHGSYVPPNAVVAGQDKDGSPLYVGRAFHEGDLLPGKVSTSIGGAFVAWGGGEHMKHDFEVLLSNHVAWQFARNGEVPPEAIAAGTTQDGEKLYIGRVLHEGSLSPGKVQPSHGCLYISFGGQEVRFNEYEVLILT